MAKKIAYPVGIQTFSEIITENYLYVDKTALVYELVKGGKYIFLSRPRRFGKSLLMSTLEAYFKGRKELFHGLAIEKLEKDWIQYPVFRFDLSGDTINDVKRLYARINRCLVNIARTYGLQDDGESPADRFYSYIQQAYEKYGERVVVLIDEYDKPMLDCLHDDSLHTAVKDELRGFYSVLKVSDEYIKFAMLTGVTRFGKVSVFSGLNNLKDISMLPKYNALCGISETEFRDNFGQSVRNFAAGHGMTEEQTWEKFRMLYDGYRFASTGENIYNPFSVLNAFDTETFGTFWYRSGSSSYLIRLIESHRYPLANLEGVRRSEEELGDITDTTRDFVPLLYQSGYLTVKGYDNPSGDPLAGVYTLGFPNQEVNRSFWTSLSRHFFRGYGNESAFDIGLFLQDINLGNPESFMMRLRSLFADTSSETEPDKEIHFQNMMAIACKMMGLQVNTEVHAHRGRCDMQIKTAAYIYIFEFKVDSTPEEALEQIHERGYHIRFEADTRTVYLIGANFSTDTRTLTGWIIEEA